MEREACIIAIASLVNKAGFIQGHTNFAFKYNTGRHFGKISKLELKSRSRLDILNLSLMP